MKSFLRQKLNRNSTNKIVFANETNLKPKGRIVFRRCPAHGVLHVYIDINNFKAVLKDCCQVTFLKIFEDGKLLFSKRN